MALAPLQFNESGLSIPVSASEQLVLHGTALAALVGTQPPCAYLASFTPLLAKHRPASCSRMGSDASLISHASTHSNGSFSGIDPAPCCMQGSCTDNGLLPLDTPACQASAPKPIPPATTSLPAAGRTHPSLPYTRWQKLASHHIMQRAAGACPTEAAACSSHPAACSWSASSPAQTVPPQAHSAAGALDSFLSGKCHCWQGFAQGVLARFAALQASCGTSSKVASLPAPLQASAPCRI